MRRSQTGMAAALIAAALWTGAAGAAEPARSASGSAGPEGATPDATQKRGEAYYRLMRATFAVRRGEVKEAMAEIRRAIELQPESADLQAESASLLWAIGRRAEAEKLARGALRLEAGNPVALRVLAELATFQATMSRGRDEKSRDEAIRLYGLLAERDDVDDETLRRLANLRMQSGDMPGAIETTRQLLAQRPGDLGVARMLAQLLREDRREAEALDILLEYMVRYGAEPNVAEQISSLARDTERWGAVEAATARRLERHPDSSLEIALRGEALLHLGRFDEAVEMLERSRGLDGGGPVLLFHLYTAYDALGRLADAADAAQELVAAMPDNPGALTVLGQALARQQQLGEAEQALRSALVGFGEDVAAEQRRDRIRLRLARIYLDQERTADATTVLDALEHPDQVEALELRFRAAVDRGRPEAARRVVQALEDQRNPGLAALLDGELLARAGKPAKARVRFREAVGLLGRHTWAAVAEIWREAGRTEDGERAARTWVGEEPDSANAHFALGSYLERLGRYDEAMRELERSIAIDPKHANALNYLGYSLADRARELDRALTLVQRALEIDPWNGAYLDSLGWVYYRMGRYDEAVGPLERAARELPSDPTVLDHLGDVYRELGRAELAVSAWNRALAARPDDPDAIRAKIRAADGDEASGRLRTGLEEQVTR